MNQLLMTIIVELCIFLEFSSDEIIDPDAAVSMMEQIAAALNQLTPGEQSEFAFFVQDLSKTEQQSGGTAERVEFLMAFPETIGLSEDINT